MRDFVPYLTGEKVDAEHSLQILRGDIFPKAIHRMNNEVLPKGFVIFEDEPMPTNQRNLTDVRTRMGVLLEYELAKSILYVLGDYLNDDLFLTYVLANRFPDLAFRTKGGGTGLRFEVKAIETIAEEKSANFDTLLKDIRKGTDFVVVLLWEWTDEESQRFTYPVVDKIFVLDAHHLAQMRNCYWLNNPPSDVGDGRQGFDLCYAVNCSQEKYNREEGNYGKLMRIFDRQFEPMLPREIRDGTTLSAYYELRDETIRLGLVKIGGDIAAKYSTQYGGSPEVISDKLPIMIRTGTSESAMLFLGREEMLNKTEVLSARKSTIAERILVMNAKFSWRIWDAELSNLAEGRKPSEAIRWLGLGDG